MTELSREEPRSQMILDGDDPVGVRLAFLSELDALKSIYRQTRLVNGARAENSAEHSWHLGVAVLLYRDFAPELDLAKMLALALVHDIVEIDAGDTFVYDEAGFDTKFERESKAAERIFGMLPNRSGDFFLRLWNEYELCETAEARFVNSLDRFLPVLQNLRTGGHSWRKHGIRKAQVLERNSVIEKGFPKLWDYFLKVLDQAESEGLFDPMEKETPANH